MRPLVIAFCSLATPSVAGELILEVPIDCDLDTTCYIQNYVDTDASDAVVDYQCGRQSYNGHKGTDFALPSMQMQRLGVDVLAAAPGIVRGTRNDMEDALQFGPDAPDVSGRECGNGVVIVHGDGWETQYCHMEQGSVSVSRGQQVEVGDVLGRVGLSGRTQFPHLHLSVRKDGEVIDPFDPDGDPKCGPSDRTLWIDDLDVPIGGFISAGFSSKVPAYDTVKEGTAGRTEIAPDQPLVAWGYLHNSQEGDELKITLIDVDGAGFFAHTETLEKTQALTMRAAGKRAPQGGWPEGRYEAVIDLSRDGQIVDSIEASVTVR